MDFHSDMQGEKEIITPRVKSGGKSPFQSLVFTSSRRLACRERVRTTMKTLTLLLFLKASLN